MNVLPLLQKDPDLVTLLHPVAQFVDHHHHVAHHHVAPLVDHHHLGADHPQEVLQWEMVRPGIHPGGHLEDRLGKDQEGHHHHSDAKWNIIKMTKAETFWQKCKDRDINLEF